MSWVKSQPKPTITDELTPVHYFGSDNKGMKPALVQKATRTKLRVVRLFDTGVSINLVPASELQFMMPYDVKPLKLINYWLLHSSKRLGISKDAKRLLRNAKESIKQAANSEQAELDAIAAEL